MTDRAQDTPELTARERQLVDAIRRGLSNRQIAIELGTSEQTVKNQLTTLYAKFDVRSRLQLLIKTMQVDVRRINSAT